MKQMTWRVYYIDLVIGYLFVKNSENMLLYTTKRKRNSNDHILPYYLNSFMTEAVII